MAMHQKEAESSKGRIHTGLYTESYRRVDRALIHLLRDVGYTREEATNLVFQAHWGESGIQGVAPNSADPQTFIHNAHEVQEFINKHLLPRRVLEYRPELLQNLETEIERLRRSLLPPSDSRSSIGRAVPRRT
ncbi:MAG: hypothetical protein ABII71_00670 [Candidatus Micrarchaeota archaeon]